MPIRMYTSNLN